MFKDAMIKYIKRIISFAIPLRMNDEQMKKTHSPFSESDLYSPFEALFFAAIYKKFIILTISYFKFVLV